MCSLPFRYLWNHQNADGGWCVCGHQPVAALTSTSARPVNGRGLHMQQPDSTMFGSAMNYAAARLLGKLSAALVGRYVPVRATSQAPTRTAYK